MRIEQINLKRYGPLKPASLELHGFNLFWAPNEHGKTLFLEALLRLLLGNIRRMFPGIERVGENPEGYAVVHLKAGDHRKLPEEGVLGDFYDLSVLEFRNLLVIRNSDLQIPEEAVFFETITERLTGMQARKIQRIKERLKQSGGFTSTMDIVNNRESHYLKRRLQQAEELLLELSQLEAQAKEARLETRLSRLKEFRREQQLLNVELEKMERAGMVKKYRTAAAELERCRETTRQLEQFRSLDVDLLVKWDVDEHSAEEADRLLNELSSERDEITVQLHQAQTALSGLEAERERLGEWLSLYQQNVENFRNRIESRKFSPLQKKMFRTTQLIALAGSAGGLGAFALGGWLSGIVSAGVLLIIFTTLTLWKYYYHTQPEKQLAQRFEKFRQECRRRKLAEVRDEHLREAAEQARSDLQEVERKLIQTAEQIRFWEKKEKEVAEKSATIGKKISAYQESLQQLKEEAKVDSLDALHEQVRRKQELEKQYQSGYGTLNALLGNPDAADPLEFWQSQLDELSRELPEEEAPPFDEQAYRDTLQAEQRLTAKIESLEKIVQRFEAQLPDFEVRANQVLAPEGKMVHCRGWKEIGGLIGALNEFIAHYKTEQELTREALDVLEKIETEETEQLKTIFDGSLSAGDLIAKISKQRYRQVRFAPQEQQLWVERADGAEIPVEWLSSGGYDQLYFAIRLSLARKVFGGQPAFLILDDPFIKSDCQRLQEQLNLLLELSREGWQILYFSAKDEVLDVLQPSIAGGVVHQQPLPGLR